MWYTEGGVLSPHLFAVYVDSLVDTVERCNIGCCVKWASVSIVLYADDILLLSPSVTGLQQLLHVCEQELDLLDMPINVAKSACLRIGPRSDKKYCNLVTISGYLINGLIRSDYLGTYLISSKLLLSSYSEEKACFYRAFYSFTHFLGRLGG